MSRASSSRLSSKSIVFEDHWLPIRGSCKAAWPIGEQQDPKGSENAVLQSFIWRRMQKGQDLTRRVCGIFCMHIYIYTYIYIHLYTYAYACICVCVCMLILLVRLCVL